MIASNAHGAPHVYRGGAMMLSNAGMAGFCVFVAMLPGGTDSPILLGAINAVAWGFAVAYALMALRPAA